MNVYVRRMKTFLKVFAVLLLAFNGLGAMYGGLLLILNPDGSSLGLDLSYLDPSPFATYLIPGLILFFANGVFSLAVLIILLSRNYNAPWFVMAQGAVLLGWIGMQLLMVNYIYFLHAVMAAAGLLLLLTGYFLLRFRTAPIRPIWLGV